MSYKPRSLFRLIEEINTSLFLPHIQRPFVWDEEQMERLFDSLMRNYPIQTLLFWRTKDAIKARQFMDQIEWDADLHEYYDQNKSSEGIEKVFVLDGQQRLQTLYALFNGSVSSANGSTHREAYFDMTSGAMLETDDLHYPLRWSDQPIKVPFYRIRDLLGRDSQKNAEEIADELNDHLDDDETLTETKEEQRERQRRVRRNCSQLVSLLREERHFWVQELDGIAQEFPYRRVLEIFVRVNSGGTKLSAADLMFAAMKEGWADVEQKIEEIVDLLNNDKLNFDKNLVLRCIITTMGKEADLSPAKFVGSTGEELLERIEQNWAKLETTFHQLRDFIFNELQIFGDKMIRSYNSFVPLFDYLYHNPSPNEINRQLMRGYYYKSQLFNWFSARTDNIVNALHNIIGKPLPTGFPMEEIKRYFATSIRAEVELTPNNMDMRLRYILLNLVYVAKHGTSPFNVRYKGNEPHIDHIYPQSSLRSQLRLSTEEINDLGNYRFIGATDNIRKRAELPQAYFQRLRTAGIEIERHLLLPDFASDPSKLYFDRETYRQFRDQRRQAIFEIANRVVNPEKAEMV
ncbi:MAG: DUF262 domain-containing protein [Caldilineaceae bacterium]